MEAAENVRVFQKESADSQVDMLDPEQVFKLLLTSFYMSAYVFSSLTMTTDMA